MRQFNCNILSIIFLQVLANIIHSWTLVLYWWCDSIVKWKGINSIHFRKLPMAKFKLVSSFLVLMAYPCRINVICNSISFLLIFLNKTKQVVVLWDLCCKISFETLTQNRLNFCFVKALCQNWRFEISLSEIPEFQMFKHFKRCAF